jgi:hypothetical protein
MDWYILGFGLVGFVCSLILFLDYGLSTVCFTRGCDIIRKHHQDKLIRVLQFFITIFFGMIIFLNLWPAQNNLVGALSAAGSVYSAYFLYHSLKKYWTQSPLCILPNISMIFVFLIWTSNLFV